MTRDRRELINSGSYTPEVSNLGGTHAGDWLAGLWEYNKLSLAIWAAGLTLGGVLVKQLVVDPVVATGNGFEWLWNKGGDAVDVTKAGIADGTEEINGQYVDEHATLSIVGSDGRRRTLTYDFEMADAYEPNTSNDVAITIKQRGPEGLERRLKDDDVDGYIDRDKTEVYVTRDGQRVRVGNNYNPGASGEKTASVDMALIVNDVASRIASEKGQTYEAFGAYRDLVVSNLTDMTIDSTRTVTHADSLQQSIIRKAQALGLTQYDSVGVNPARRR